MARIGIAVQACTALHAWVTEMTHTPLPAPSGYWAGHACMHGCMITMTATCCLLLCYVPYVQVVRTNGIRTCTVHMKDANGTHHVGMGKGPGRTLAPCLCVAPRPACRKLHCASHSFKLGQRTMLHGNQQHWCIDSLQLFQACL